MKRPHAAASRDHSRAGAAADHAVAPARAAVWAAPVLEGALLHVAVVVALAAGALEGAVGWDVKLLRSICLHEVEMKCII